MSMFREFSANVSRYYLTEAIMEKEWKITPNGWCQMSGSTLWS